MTFLATLFSEVGLATIATVADGTSNASYGGSVWKMTKSITQYENHTGKTVKRIRFLSQVGISNPPDIFTIYDRRTMDLPEKAYAVRLGRFVEERLGWKAPCPGAH